MHTKVLKQKNVTMIKRKYKALEETIDDLQSLKGKKITMSWGL